MSLGENWPDVEGAVKAFLQADPDVAGSAAAGRVYFAVPETPTFPLITVVRISGGEIRASEVPLDVALVQIDVRGQVKRLGECDDVRRAVRKALSKIRQATPVAGKGVLYGANVLDDRRQPEPAAQDTSGAIGERPRYALTVQVSATA